MHFLEVDVSILVNKPTTLILIYVAMYNRLLFCEVNLFKDAITTCPSVILIIKTYCSYTENKCIDFNWFGRNVSFPIILTKKYSVLYETSYF